MATINRGILDGFYGKVGTVVGTFWKGIPVMRAYVRRQRDPKMTSQQEVRRRFAAIGKLSSAFLSATRVGFRNAAAALRATESNIFVDKNWGFVTLDADGQVVVDYTQLVVAQGALTGVFFAEAAYDVPKQVTVTYEANGDYDDAQADDMVYLFVYSPRHKRGLLSLPAPRSEQSVSVKVPNHWSGNEVHVWGFTVGADGKHSGVASDSTYIGSGTLA